MRALSGILRRPGQRTAVKPQTIKRGKGETALPYAMIAPLLVFIGALALYPTIKTAYGAFVHNDALDPPTHFAGFANFQDVFNNAQVRGALENTGIYVIFGVVMSVALGVYFGLLLQRNFRGRGVVLALMVLPWALPGVVEGVIWAWIYDPTFGVLNSGLKTIGVIHNYQLWIGTHQLQTIFFISLVQVWQITPLAAILVLASLQAIPSELYEAADVDGATRLQSIKRITLPLIRPALAIAVVEGLVMSLNIFDQVYVLNAGATTGSSLMSETYQITFGNLNFGDGYALSLLATVTTIALSLLAVKIIYRKVEF
jgi:multiple sugar transport system permease protein